MIWTSFLNSDKPFRFSFVTSLPSKKIFPSVLSNRWIRVRPRVDLPQPDSPTRPIVSPTLMAKETSSTAWTFPAPVVKYFFRCSASTNFPMSYLLSARKQRTKCPGVVSTFPGFLVRQASVALGQRGANGQESWYSTEGSGGSPGMGESLGSSFVKSGRAPNRPMV